MSSRLHLAAAGQREDIRMPRLRIRGDFIDPGYRCARHVETMEPAG